MPRTDHKSSSSSSGAVGAVSVVGSVCSVAGVDTSSVLVELVTCLGMNVPVISMTEPDENVSDAEWMG